MSSDLRLVELPRDRAGIQRFFNVALRLYRDDPHWVAPPLYDMRRAFSDANPWFAHAEMQLWVAERRGQDIGRIAAIVDRHHNERHRDAAAFFGFYECAPDAEASRALFERVFDWARRRGLNHMLGPINPTTNDECGLLIEGFGQRPTFMMPYNPPYYLEQVEGAGFRKAKDLLAFYVDVAQAPLERLNRIATRTRQRHPEVRFTPVRRRTLAGDLTKIKEVYNAAWEDNWGFTPMTDAEIDFMAARLKPLLVEGLVWLAETARETVGFMLALPDFNEVLQPLRGRVFTLRALGALPYVLGWKYPKRCRVVTLGTKKTWRGRGLEAVMLSEGFRVGIGLGFTEAEASWVLEDNTMMCRFMDVFGARVYRRYRIYERSL